MKNLLFILSFSFLMLFSCSSGDDESSNSDFFLQRYDRYVWKSTNQYLITKTDEYSIPDLTYVILNSIESCYYIREQLEGVESSNSRERLLLTFYERIQTGSFSWTRGDLIKIVTFTVNNNILKEETEYFANGNSTNIEVKSYQFLTVLNKSSSGIPSSEGINYCN